MSNEQTHSQISEACFNLVKTSEGCRLTAYQDQKGVWSIGYGHTDGVIRGMVITQEQAEEFLKEDICWAMVDVLRMCPQLTGNKLDALVSFVYNVGMRQWQKSTLCKVIQRNPEDWVRIHAEWRRWVFVNKVYNLGLVRRRERELKLYCGSYYVRP